MNYLENTIKMHQAMVESLDTHQITKIAETIVGAYQKGKKLIVFGNGGSAADAIHFAAELEGQLSLVDKGRKPYRAVALSNLSSITAIGNDFGFDHVFVRFVEGNADEGDIVFGISTSGNSKNVLKAIHKANEIGAITIGLTGQDGGELKSAAQLSFCVQATNVSIIQEGHLMVYHRICALIVKMMSGFDCLA